MHELLQVHFRHRHNVDGIIDSICCECFATVASVRIESELTDMEEAHECVGHVDNIFRLKGSGW